MPPTDEFGWLSQEDADPLLEDSTPVAELFPKEVQFFRHFWIDLASVEGYYLRSAYFDRLNKEGYLLRKWRPDKYTNSKTGRRHFSRFDDATRKREIEKHLNWPGYVTRTRKRFKNVPEPAHWFGTLAGPQTRSDAIDLDSHSIVGFYRVPTFDAGFRELPVPKCGIEFFEVMKRMHDAFPERIWMTTSANLGKCLWQLHRRLVSTKSIYQDTHRQLADIGLDLEIYPQPPSSAFSLGKCHRRPFGLDSALHTEDGIIVSPIRQIRAVMERNTTISWASLFHQHIEMMKDAYWFWKQDKAEPTNEAKDSIEAAYLDRPKADVLKELRDDIAKAEDWFDRGCPCSMTTVVMTTYTERDKDEELADQEPPVEEGKTVEYRGRPHVVLPRGYPHLTMHQRWTLLEIIEPSGAHRWLLPLSAWKKADSVPGPASTAPRTVEPPAPIQFTPKARKKSRAEEEWEAFEHGRSLAATTDDEPWSKEKASSLPFWTYLVELSRNGVPEEDRLFGFLVDLAAPLYWRDYFDLHEIEREERVVADLLFWVSHKNNGRVSRLSSKAGILDIEREIRNAVRAVQECGPGIKYYYAQIRQNDKRFPHRTQRLASLIREVEDIHSPLVHCKRRVLVEGVSAIPTSIEEVLQDIVNKRPRLACQGKSTFLDFSRRFLVTIWLNKGRVHLNWQTLNAFRGKPDAKDRKQVLLYKKLLADAGVIYEDWEKHARRGVASCLYRLTKKAKAAFEQDFQQANRADEA